MNVPKNICLAFTEGIKMSLKFFANLSIPGSNIQNLSKCAQELIETLEKEKK